MGLRLYDGCRVPRISDEQSPDKILGEAGRRVEVTVVEVVVDGGDVAKGLVTRLTQKGGSAAQQSETSWVGESGW